MITGKTKIYALFGDPVTHSVSPVMHNSAFEFLGMDCCYVPFRVQNNGLQAAINAVRVMGIKGVNITIPHKKSVINYLDEVDRNAELIGAVNTIVNKNGRLLGYNTDGYGFLAFLRSEAGFDPQHKRIVLIGAGGAARAVAFTLALEGAEKITIFNRSPDKAEILADELYRTVGCDVEADGLNSDLIDAELALADLLVHASPAGMFPNCEERPPVNTEKFKGGLLVCDLIYNPLKTRLLREAEKSGCRIFNGIGMLVFQGALAFEIWTGQPAPLHIMRAAVEKALFNNF